MPDTTVMEKSEDFDKLPESYVIFITEHDIMKMGKPIYQVERCILGTDKRFDDGSHILYVNGTCQDSTPLGKLMHDFSCSDPADMNYGVLAERTRFFKETKEGVTVMCKIMEDMRNETLKQEKINTALRLLKAGKLSIEEIAEGTELTIDEVKKLDIDRTA